MNQVAINFIKEREGCRLTAYPDSGGKSTIGYGHTGPEVKAGLVWSQAQADAALAADVMKAEAAVGDLVKVLLSENQRAALISFVFNLGQTNFQNSTILTLLNQSDFMGAAYQFQRWDFADGKEVRGLLIRRLAEAILFLEGTNDELG